MSRATLPGPVSPTPPQAAAPAPSSAPLRAGRANLRHAYDLALAGGLGALFGLYLYVELVHAESVYVRDAFAGLLIGGSLGVFLSSKRSSTAATRGYASMRMADCGCKVVATS